MVTAVKLHDGEPRCGITNLLTNTVNQMGSYFGSYHFPIEVLKIRHVSVISQNFLSNLIIQLFSHHRDILDCMLFTCVIILQKPVEINDPD